MGAPKVVASGRGLIAERIVRGRGGGRRGDTQRTRDLAEALAGLDLGREIPETVAAVAEALAWEYALDVKARRGV